MPLASRRWCPGWPPSSLHCSLLLLLLLLHGLGAERTPQEEEELSNCARMAEPLVKNPEIMFPLTTGDLERVCKLWREFQRCARTFIANHLSEEEQRNFQEAVGSAFQSLDQLCRSDPETTRVYLENAPCLRQVSLNESLCGSQYKYLVDLVQGLRASDVQMCCAHLKFRECMLQKVDREWCDQGRTSVDRRTSSDFTRSMLDRSLGFFLQTCKNFVPNARDCPRFNSPGGATSSPGFNHNGHHLRPDSTISSTPPPVSTQPTSSFTWTPSSRSTTPSLALAGGNSLLGPESQQYKGSSTTIHPALTSALTGVLLLLRLL